MNLIAEIEAEQIAELGKSLTSVPATPYALALK